MQVIQPVEKVTHMSTQYGEYAIVPILANKSDKVHAHLIHKFMFGDTQYLLKDGVVEMKIVLRNFFIYIYLI